MRIQIRNTLWIFPHLFVRSSSRVSVGTPLDQAQINQLSHQIEIQLQVGYKPPDADKTF